MLFIFVIFIAFFHYYLFLQYPLPLLPTSLSPAVSTLLPLSMKILIFGLRIVGTQ